VTDHHFFRDAVPVTLEEMLLAREERQKQQKELLNRYGQTLLCFTMNIPGPYKTYPLAEKGFRAGIQAMEAQLKAEGIPTVYQSVHIVPTGCTYWSILGAPAATVKKLAMEVEQQHPLGRLYDMDVFDADGRALRGEDFGRKERTCLICQEPVWVCSRSRAHSAQELSLHVAKLLWKYDCHQFSQKAGLAAVQALLYEVSATPKPGLVDRSNNGSHRDMNFFTFLDSGTALIPYFQHMTAMGLAHQGTAQTLIPALRYQGRQAEGQMFAATGGVNTHKGLIFSLGLLCACAGYQYAQDLSPTADQLLELAALAAGGVTKELDCTATPATHGRRAYGRYCATGIRGEAAAGYPHVRKWGLPVLKKMAAQGCSLNDAGVIALLHLMAHLEDTNILARADRDTLLQMQALLRKELSRTQDPAQLLSFARFMDEWMVLRGLSPGGSADLLAVSYFLYFLY
jgi:holo-ACP synthase/triphosphoribosyl-dephospho-CoA synthase